MPLCCEKCGQSISPTRLILKAIGSGTSNVNWIKSQMPLEMSDKEIYNALGYLTRKKLVERLGYGLYKRR
jgi:hypothetical protein